MPSYYVQNNDAEDSSVLTEFQPVISHGGPNPPHFLFVKNLTFWPKSIAHLEPHHLAAKNEAGRAPSDPPRRVSMKDLSLSQICNRANPSLKRKFGKPALDRVVRVRTVTLKMVLPSEQYICSGLEPCLDAHEAPQAPGPQCPKSAENHAGGTILCQSRAQA